MPRKIVSESPEKPELGLKTLLGDNEIAFHEAHKTAMEELQKEEVITTT